MPKTKVRETASHEPTLLGTPGAARFFSVAEQTIRRWVAEGVLPCERDHANRRVFRRTDLEARRRQLAR